jgi:D-glycero-D-manno-heptose 1,7-bisphosphate phosphatase
MTPLLYDTSMKVVFLDRDGTVIVDPPDLRVKSVADLQLFPDTIAALKLLADNDFAVVLITNQAGIAEGLLTQVDFVRIHAKCLQMLQPSGVKILGTYMCPHDQNDNCDCRKPKPKMLLQALTEYNLQAKDVFMVGDRPSDVDAGIAAGTKTILVQTANSPVSAPQATFTAAHLLDAVRYILGQ